MAESEQDDIKVEEVDECQRLQDINKDLLIDIRAMGVDIPPTFPITIGVEMIIREMGLEMQYHTQINETLHNILEQVDKQARLNQLKVEQPTPPWVKRQGFITPRPVRDNPQA